MFLIPAVVLLSWLIDPLALGFREVEIGALAISLAVVMVTIWGGVSSRLRGGILIAAYVARRDVLRRGRRRTTRRSRRTSTAPASPDTSRSRASSTPLGVADARSSSPRSRPSTTRQRSARRLETETVRPGGAADELRLEPPLRQRQDHLLALRPPRPEHAARRSAGGAAPGARARGRPSQQRRARRPRDRARASPGSALAPVFVSTAAPVRVCRWTTSAGQEARHRAAVPDEDAVAAAARARARAPSRRVQRSLVDHRLDAAISLERRADEDAVVPVAEERRPSARGRRPSTRASRRRPCSPSPRDRARPAPCRRTDRRSTASRSAPPGRSVVRESPSGSRMRSCSDVSYEHAACRATISPSSAKTRFE